VKNTGENKYSKTSTNDWTLLAQLPLLDKHEEYDLGVAIQEGLAAKQELANNSKLSEREKRRLRFVAADGDEARRTLFNHNVRLGLKEARQTHGGTLTEREQDAVLGVWRATETFDPYQGTRFSTYAMPWIRNFIGRGSGSDRLIHLPEEVQLEAKRMYGFVTEFAKEYQREATHAEIAEGLGVSIARVTELLRVSRGVDSLDVARTADGDLTLGDLIVDGNYDGLSKLEDALEAGGLLGVTPANSARTVEAGGLIRPIDVEPLNRLMQFMQQGGRQ
jgi:DNA-directed RNA polymerase sigma subunit (sigma70/sigma32)